MGGSQEYRVRVPRLFIVSRCRQQELSRALDSSCKKRGFCPSCGARRMAETAALLADEVFPDVPLRQWVISFPFPLRYLFAAHPQAMGKVLGIVYRAISTHLIHKAGLSLRDGATGAVTLIQRFGSALNLNIHFHILFLDGVYLYRDNRPPRFQRVKAPSKRELEDLVQSISQRVGRCLERQGLLEQDTESAWLDLNPAEDTDAMPQILGSSITYRIAVGPQQGRKALMIRTIRPLDRPDPGLERVATANGFSLHAGVSCEGNQRGKRERLCRYISRPAVAVPRLSLSSTGKVVYTLKTPYRDGTTQVAFEPVDFVARLAALVPKPRVNLTRYHGVLAPNHRWRGLVTPARRGKGIKSIANAEVRTPAERHAAMTWAQRLKRVFNIDIEVCSRCGGSVRVIASIEDQETVDRILDHLRQKEQETPARPLLVPPTSATWNVVTFRWEGFQTNSNPLARKPGIPHGTSGCARSFRIDRIGMAFPTPRTGFSVQ